MTMWKVEILVKDRKNPKGRDLSFVSKKQEKIFRIAEEYSAKGNKVIVSNFEIEEPADFAITVLKVCC